MTQLILQPVGAKGWPHYQDTVLTGVPRETLLAHLADQPPALRSLLEGEAVWKVWGVVSSPGGNNVRQWLDLQPGATVLFYFKRMLIASAEVVAKVRHASLARELWGVDETDLPWENMYVLANHQPLDIDIEVLQPLMGWGPNQWVRGFTLVGGARADQVLAGLGKASPELAQAQIQQRLQSAVVGSTDVQGYRTVRREQRALRDWLLQGQAEGTCCLCGQTYPKRFLWASHLKPRSKCSEAERMDPAVVTLMCKFGCDDLYEHGDVFVDKGVVRGHARAWATPALTAHLETLDGRLCTAYTPATRTYFDWHAAQAQPHTTTPAGDHGGLP